tara:strand:- start:41 stop:490 length:450 start_codon:yes stop_codon:yes gene_type:complete
MSTGVYMPSGISERVDHLVLAVDTSGSMSQAVLSTALSEVKGICDTVCPAKITLIYWGWGVVRVETYDEYNIDTLVDSTKPKDGGGTDVNCVPAYLRDNHIDAQAVVVFTDGYLGDGWGKWDWPVLWGIFDNTGAVPDVGKTTHIDTRR